MKTKLVNTGLGLVLFRRNGRNSTKFPTKVRKPRFWERLWLGVAASLVVRPHPDRTDGFGAVAAAPDRFALRSVINFWKSGCRCFRQGFSEHVAAGKSPDYDRNRS